MIDGQVTLDLPFRGRWLARNSPARRIPSHGTDRFGVTYAIDFIAVDDRDRSAPRSWRSVLSVEQPDTFIGFGKPILAPASGIVAAVHDGERDHVARRSQLALIPYALGQPGRVRRGLPAIAGNCVVIALGPDGPYSWLVHLRRGTVRVKPGDEVTVGEQVAECGNSGNSTQPHVHLQVTDSTEWQTARGIPVAFRSYRRVKDGHVVTTGIPAESEIIEPV
jgi:hypothetical protein